jgi:Pretoxin HINT domain
MVRRSVLVLLAAVALLTWGPATTAGATSYAYDVPTIARVHVHLAVGDDLAETEFTAAREGSASTAVEARSPSTTLSPRSVATEAEGELELVCHSFDPRTEVVMADGSRKQIAGVKIGDHVRTTDPATGASVVREVSDVHVNRDSDLADLTIRDSEGREATVHTTEHHKFWDDTRGGWVEATDLGIGDRLHDLGRRIVTVVGVNSRGGTHTMYDLTIDGVHTYYVEVDGIDVLVHNCGEGMLGENGTQVTSKTLTPGNRGYRIDVENPAPGVRPGQLHLQDAAGGKYLYNFETGEFEGIPNSLAKAIANDPAVARAIAKGAVYLGLGG